MKTYVISIDEIWYQHKHRKKCYVCTERDVDEMGWVEFYLEDLGFPTRQEAEQRMQDLKKYADENGFECVGWGVEEFEV